MSGLEVNKILASIILAILVVTVIGHLGDIIIDTEHHDMEETAYKIDVPESGEVVPGAAPKVEVIEPISLLLASASIEKIPAKNVNMVLHKTLNLDLINFAIFLSYYY